MPSAAQLKGFHRDREILLAIEKLQALTTDQVTALFFEGSESSQRKARERLLKLYQMKKIKRCRYSLNEPYCYYLGRKHGRLEHLIELNWVYVWLTNNLRSWEQFYCFKHEYNLGVLQADALAGIRNTVTGKTKFSFVELDRSDNDFDKVEKYNRLYESDGYTRQWWSELADRFPNILVVTTTERRRAKILERVKQDNVNGLEFTIILNDEIKREC
ncbi:replication-relaxation family protein [Desulforamulus aquiferis]|uniref:Replication-relaxation family protein n=1 Tax=Desulforamulus aquiferis TaxID=1397668 RepID=A0AAW7Z8W0_9FIRM|nr:replication-relaxation family protein [Desulforamulus aquiferis]MDO7786109.1 replication-relaxation family protein [Desulforamulus aquiferis]